MHKEQTFGTAQQRLSASDDLMQMVGFVVAGELFCVDILTVQEIIKNAGMTAIPDAPEFILGVINLRGNIIPVIDLCKRLNLSASDRAEGDESWIIIINIGGRVAGFTVDRVTRVLKIPENAIKPPPELILGGLKGYYVSGVVKSEERLLAILDFNRVLSVDEFKKISLAKRQQLS